ncbi:hypothetical protein LCGC14_0764650 [marine sediment metagenome]|uniref:Uncharacterized protein n=1 Tax=marine sediment metagenome TaxID=412755 RepID=A0A0F9QJY6_9ZZZZ
MAKNTSKKDDEVKKVKMVKCTVVQRFSMGVENTKMQKYYNIGEQKEFPESQVERLGPEKNKLDRDIFIVPGNLDKAKAIKFDEKIKTARNKQFMGGKNKGE